MKTMEHRYIIIFLLFASISSFSTNSEAGVKVRAPQDGFYHCGSVGLWSPVSDTDLQIELKRYDNLVNNSVHITRIPVDWSQGVNSSLTTGLLDYLSEVDQIPLLMISPEFPESLRSSGESSLDLILSRKYDATIKRFFSRLADLRNSEGKSLPIMLSFAPFFGIEEFEGYSYSFGANGGSRIDRKTGLNIAASKFKRAYRHVHNLAALTNANNLTWVLGVQRPREPKRWNQLHHYYPGDRYVDWVGIGLFAPADQPDDWSSFSSLDRENVREKSGVPSMFDQAEKIAPKKPKLILDLRVSEKPRRPSAKADVIRDAFDILRRRSQDYFGICYENEDLWPGYQNNRWINSSQEALDSYLDGLRSLNISQGVDLSRSKDNKSSRPAASTTSFIGLLSDEYSTKAILNLNQSQSDLSVRQLSGTGRDKLSFFRQRPEYSKSSSFYLSISGAELPKSAKSIKIHVSWLGDVPKGNVLIYDSAWEILFKGPVGTLNIPFRFKKNGPHELGGIVITSEQSKDMISFSIDHLFLSYK